MIIKHAINVLNDHGYGDSDLDVRFSLSHSQGDGVAFFGGISDPCLEELINRLVSVDYPTPPVERIKNLILRYELQDMRAQAYDCFYHEPLVEIIENQHAQRYFHANTMEVEASVDVISSLADQISGGITDDPEQNKERLILTEKMLDKWEVLTDLLKSDLAELSYKIEVDGYKIIDAIVSETTVLWEISTKNFSVTVSEVPSDLVSDYGPAANRAESIFSEDVLADNALREIIYGDARIIGLEAKVVCHSTGSVIGRESVMSVICHDRKDTLKLYKTDLVKQAISYARRRLEKIDGLAIAS